MIAHVIGKVAEKFNGTVIIDVHGVGYEVNVAANDYDAALSDKDAKFYTYHHIREQSQELFGFSTLAAKKLFELLITVQGVGPKAALSILSLGEGESVRSAIASADVGFISRASGVGKKTAERVTVDLRDKVGAPTYVPGHDPATGGISNLAGDEALDALMALGYNLAEATQALAGIDPSLPTAKRVSEALKDRN